MSDSDWEHKLGRLVVNDETRASRQLGKLVSGRVGSNGRTFHCAVERIPATTSRSAIRSRLHYDKRDAEHENRIDELESEGGRTNAEMEEILAAACKAQTRKNGVAALTLKVELPAEMTARHRKEVAEAIAAWFEDRDCPAHWAVHSHNEKNGYQPHLHMTVTNRPVRPRPIREGWSAVAAGTRGRPGHPAVINGAEEMSYFRREVVARAINTVARRHDVDLAAEWHGGTLAETGIERMAKKRVPMAAYKGRLTPRPDGPAWANTQIDQGNVEAVEDARRRWSQQQIEARQVRAAERAAAKEARRLAKLTELGGVPKEAVQRSLESLTEKQVQTLTEVHQRLGLETPDLETHDGRAAAWAVVKAEKAMRERRGNPQAEAPKKAASRDWAAMSLEQFIAAKGIKVIPSRLRKLEFEVHLPGGTKVIVAARDETRAKAAAHEKLVESAMKRGADVGTHDQEGPVWAPTSATAAATTRASSTEPTWTDAQRRIATMSETELQDAIARTRGKYAPPPAPAAVAPASPTGEKEIRQARPSSPSPPIVDTPASGGGAEHKQTGDDWAPDRPRGRRRQNEERRSPLGRG